MAHDTDDFQPGDRVKVVQQIPQRDGDCWTSETEGVVVKYEQNKTGSWYAHSRDERLWLDRLTLRLDDGEVVVLILDRYTHVERVDSETHEAPEAPEAANTEVSGGGFDYITGRVPESERPGEGLPDTPSGDLGAATEKP